MAGIVRTMTRMHLITAILAVLCAYPALPAAQTECRQPAPLQLRVRFANEAARDALLESTPDRGLRLVDPASRRVLWAADMNAAFGSSFTAIHLDADGVHDRVYAGDQAGRLWRFDLRTGAQPSEWMHAIVLAELGAAGGGRGFIAPPDVTRLQAADGRSWLSIALGSANTGSGQAEQRFYVVRDSLDSRPPARSLKESDLQPVTSLMAAPDSEHGYYLLLAHAQVVARALTVNGVTHFSAIADRRNLLTGCNTGIQFNLTQVSVNAIRATDGALTHGIGSSGPDNPHQLLAGTLSADTAVELTVNANADGRLLCHVDGETLPGCFVDTRPRRTWWRREDAD
jgi:hypothetical protein